MYANGPKIPTDGLVLCLDAGNIKSYPTSGTVWTDISRSNNNGTLAGSVISGVFSGASFNAANQGSLYMRGDGFFDDVTVPFTNFDVGNKAPNCSLSFWCNMENQPTLNQDVVGFRDGSDFDFYFLVLANGDTEARLRNNTVITTLSTSFSNFFNKWTCVTMTATANLFSLYINGNLITSAGISGNFGAINSNFRIGLIQSKMYKGYISSVLFYKRCLSAQEVLQCYNAYKGRYKL